MNTSNSTDPADTFSQAQFTEFINCNDESILMECVHYIISSIQICDFKFIHELIIPSITKLLSRTTPINVVQYLISIIPDICDVFFERFPDDAQNLLLNSVLPIIHAIALNSKNASNALRPALLSKSSSNSNLRKNLPQKSNANTSSNQKNSNTPSIFSSSSSFNNFDLNPQIVDVLSETWASLITMLDFNNFIVIEIPYIRMISSSPKKESRIVVLKVLSFLVGFYDPEAWFTPLLQIINQLATDNSGAVRALLPPLIVQLAHKLPLNNRFEFEGQASPRSDVSPDEINKDLQIQSDEKETIDNTQNIQVQNEENNNVKDKNDDANDNNQNQKDGQKQNEANNDPNNTDHQDISINAIPQIPNPQKNPTLELVRFCAIYTIFSRDSNTLVRKACAESLVSLCDLLDYSNRLVTIIPISNLLLSDQSEIVRNIMQRNLGPLISSLGSKLSSPALVQKYCTALMSKDVSAAFPAAFSFPAVTIALGHERFNELTNGFHAALNSKEFRIRRTLSFGLLSFAHILSKDELFEVVMNFLNDISSVAIGVMNNLNVIATMLDKKDTNSLIKCLEKPSEKYDQWRMRLKVSEQLRYCCDIFVSSNETDDDEEIQSDSNNNSEIQINNCDESQNNNNKENQTNSSNCESSDKSDNTEKVNKGESIAKQNLEILKNSAKELLLDPVSVVRKDAVLSYAYLMEKDNESDQKFVLDLAKSDKYTEREIAASIFEFVDLEKINGIINILLNILLNDKVANVRISVANAVMSIASVLPESNENHHLITEAIEKLKKDSDLDVRSAILN
ncbi:hypothetical protein M9Y10_023292 [Tritrichomonas musculus]|uniref:HEAT repeat family protein n=1 Tax=Tritrichomonas musculus TaxID=1915356 RepID=A0ABR2KVC5_9EUKA